MDRCGRWRRKDRGHRRCRSRKSPCPTRPIRPGPPRSPPQKTRRQKSPRPHSYTARCTRRQNWWQRGRIGRRCRNRPKRPPCTLAPPLPRCTPHPPRVPPPQSARLGDCERADWAWSRWPRTDRASHRRRSRRTGRSCRRTPRPIGRPLFRTPQRCHRPHCGKTHPRPATGPPARSTPSRSSTSRVSATRSPRRNPRNWPRTNLHRRRGRNPQSSHPCPTRYRPRQPRPSHRQSGPRRGCDTGCCGQSWSRRGRCGRRCRNRRPRIPSTSSYRPRRPRPSPRQSGRGRCGRAGWPDARQRQSRQRKSR